MLNLPSHAFNVMIVIISILIFCLLIMLRSSSDELKTRTRSWCWMILLLFGMFYLGSTATIVFFGLLSFMALKEFLSIVPVRQEDRNAIFWLYIAIPIQYYWVSQHWYGMCIIFVPVYVFLFIPIRMVVAGKTDGFIRSTAIMHWAAMLTIFCISHMAFLLELPVKNRLAGNIGLLLFLLIITQAGDIAQYVWGKLLGKRKIIPKVSPNKTWAGFIGGLLSMVLLGTLLGPYLTPMGLWQSLVCGAIISIAGFWGDLIISAVKRDIGIKDTGTLIPGHGGLLDRIDSLIYTAPVFFHFIHYFYY